MSRCTQHTVCPVAHCVLTAAAAAVGDVAVKNAFLTCRRWLYMCAWRAVLKDFIVNTFVSLPPPPPMPQQPPVGQSLLIIEASRSHSDAPQSVGLLWTGDQPDAETSA
jgi:hypothetical protein